MCAKVTGPLYSMTASGKIADAMVFFPWKGKNIVRQWLKPSNPQSADQGDVRLILGGTGRTGKAVAENSFYIAEARLVAPAGQTWLSYLVGSYIAYTMQDAAAFEAIYAVYAGHGQKAYFDSEAAALGLTTFDVAYKGTTNSYAAGLQLFVLAHYGVYQHTLSAARFNHSCFTKSITTWDAADIDILVVDLAETV